MRTKRFQLFISDEIQRKVSITIYTKECSTCWTLYGNVLRHSLEACINICFPSKLANGIFHSIFGIFQSIISLAGIVDEKLLCFLAIIPLSTSNILWRSLLEFDVMLPNLQKQIATSYLNLSKRPFAKELFLLIL